MASGAGIPADDLRRHQRRDAARRPPRRARSARASPPHTSARRASSSGSATRSRRRAGSSSTRARRGCCARAAPACCRSGSSASRASFAAGDAVEVVADGEVVGKGIADYSAPRLGAAARPQERRGAASVIAARRRRGDPPGSLRAALGSRTEAAGTLRDANLSEVMAVTTDYHHRDLPARRSAPRCARHLLDARRRTRRCARRPRGCCASAPTRSSRPTRADLDDERAAGLDDGAARPAGARPRSGSRRWPTGVEAIVALPIRSARCSTSGRSGSGLELRAGAGAARRRRDRLRGAPERDDRRRRAVPEERQRDRAARIELRRAPRTPSSPAIVREAVAEAGLPDGRGEAGRRRRPRGARRAGDGRSASST